VPLVGDRTALRAEPALAAIDLVRGGPES